MMIASQQHAHCGQRANSVQDQTLSLLNIAVKMAIDYVHFTSCGLRKTHFDTNFVPNYMVLQICVPCYFCGCVCFKYQNNADAPGVQYDEMHEGCLKLDHSSS